MKTRPLILTLFTCLCACTNYNDEISELHKEIDSIRNENIATINEQVKSIQVSITYLENYKTGLEGYIKDLQEQDKLLKDAIEAAMSSIKDNADDISSLDGKVSQSEAAISALETRLSSFEGALTTLQSLYESLDGKIASLKEYVEEELSKVEGGVKEWANATFCTLEQYYGVTDAITAINSSITLINTSLAEMENSISDLDEKLSAEIDSKLASAISTARTELEASWKEDIEAASTALESSLKTWVNSQLEGYYTAAETDAKLTLAKQELERELVTQQESLERQIEELDALVENGESENADTLAAMRSRISALQQNLDEVTKSNEESIASLRSDLIKVKQALTVEYQSAIEIAITENNGLIDNKIATAISNANSSLASQISSINSELEALVGRVAALEVQVADIKSEVAGLQQKITDIQNEIYDLKNRLANILKHIQSVTFVPKYSDGNVYVQDGFAELDFLVSPKEVVADIADNWENMLSIKCVYTQTKAVSFESMPIISCESDKVNGTISLKVSDENLCEEFHIGTQPASLSLLVSDGENEISSPFVQVAPYHPYNEIWYTTADKNIITPDVYADKVKSSYYVGYKGILLFDGPVTTIPVDIFFINTSTYCYVQRIWCPDTVVEIEEKAFYSCSWLTDISFSKNLTTIGRYAFYNCTRLKNVYIEASVPPAMGDYAFYSTYADGVAKPISGITFYVPMEAVDTYKTASGWKTFADCIVGYEF